MYRSTVTTQPTGTAVAVADVKKQLEIADDVKVHDAQLDAYVTAAVNHVEKQTNHHLLQRTLTLSFDSFPPFNCLNIPVHPVQSVNSMTIDGDTVDMSQFTIDLATPARIGLKEGRCWPEVPNQIAAVQLELVTGYAGQIPQELKQAILLIVAHWFENREEVVTGTIATQLPMAAEMLIDGFKQGDDFVRVF